MKYARSWVVVCLCVLASFGTACSTRGRGSGTTIDGGLVPGCDPRQDSDGDGIADINEGTDDRDHDGTPNYLDIDSDGDGIDDATEHGGANPCARPDADMDGLPDWWDDDSDNDGLSDAEERMLGTDPFLVDTDGDGISDLGEVRGTMTDPTDPGAGLPEGDFFVVLPYYGDRQGRTLTFGTNISVADVYFLIDTTGSMGGPIANVRTSLTSVAAQIQARIENVQMGVGHFEDFPNDASGLSFTAYGAPGDKPYEHRVDITADLAMVQSGLNSLLTANGADSSEAHVEALYQTATGMGGSWTFAAGGAPFTIPPRSCPSIPDEIGTRRGYPCFRPGSLPIVVEVSDITWHNGPGGSDPYSGITPPPHTFDEAGNALRSIGARFIGVCVDGGGRTEAEAMARLTGTVDGSGNPLVYDAASGAVSDAIVNGIETLTGGTPQDVNTRTANVPGNPDEFDATLFIKAITPVEGYRDGIAGTGYESKDDTTFFRVIPGTLVEFSIDFYNDVREPADTAQIFQARIIVVGNGVADLDSHNVYIVVPPDGGTILI